MIYREYGNTGIRLSQLGFGAMRLPNDDEEAVRIMRAFSRPGSEWIILSCTSSGSELEKPCIYISFVSRPSGSKKS